MEAGLVLNQALLSCFQPAPTVLQLQLVYDHADCFQSTSQFLAKWIWIHFQLRVSKAFSKCFTKIQTFCICYVCFIHLFWISIKKAIKLFWQVLFYIYTTLFLTLTLSHSGKLSPSAACLCYCSLHFQLYNSGTTEISPCHLMTSIISNLSSSKGFWQTEGAVLWFFSLSEPEQNKLMILVSFIFKSCAAELFHLNSKYLSANIWPICRDVLLITGVRRVSKNRSRFREKGILTKRQWAPQLPCQRLHRVPTFHRAYCPHHQQCPFFTPLLFAISHRYLHSA